MPVRSLSSSVLKWPGPGQIRPTLIAWAKEAARLHPETISIGWFGSYVTGNWGVGSDVDLLVLIDHATEPFESRMTAWDTSKLPVPTDLFVYSSEEWAALVARGGFAESVRQQVQWVYER